MRKMIFGTSKVTKIGYTNHGKTLVLYRMYHPYVRIRGSQKNSACWAINIRVSGQANRNASNKTIGLIEDSWTKDINCCLVWMCHNFSL